MNLTQNETHALKAIASAGESASGDAKAGWWSSEILMYAKDCPLKPRTFAAACGSLAKKGLTSSMQYDRGMRCISITNAGMDALIAIDRKELNA